MTDQKRDESKDAGILWDTDEFESDHEVQAWDHRQYDTRFVRYVPHSDLVAAEQREKETRLAFDASNSRAEMLERTNMRLHDKERELQADVQKYRQALAVLLEEINAAPLAVHGGQRDIDRFELALRVAREFAAAQTKTPDSRKASGVNCKA